MKHHGLMQRLERLVVHVEEAVRLGGMADEAHRRLGLMLLDSAAELMMYREWDWRLNNVKLYSSLLRDAEARYEATGEGADRVAEYRELTVSNARRKKIDHDFNAKCNYLGEKGLLAVPQVRTLKKLHAYRNETYHRDRLRPATLASAVKIYIYLVCSMMRDFPVYMMGYTVSDPPPGLAKYITSDDPSTPFGSDFELQARIASSILEQSGVAEPSQLRMALAQHVRDRLDGLEEAAEHSAGFFRSQIQDDDWDFAAVLGFVQASSKVRMSISSSDEARALDAPIGVTQIRQWREAGEALSSKVDDLVAFAAFADLEDAFEPIEEKVISLASDVEAEIQLQFDIARGK